MWVGLAVWLLKTYTYICEFKADVIAQWAYNDINVLLYANGYHHLSCGHSWMNTSSFRDKEAGRKGQQPHFTLKDSQLLLLSVVIFVDTFLVHSCLTFHVLDVLKVHFSMHMFISTMLRMLCICVRIYIYPQLLNIVTRPFVLPYKLWRWRDLPGFMWWLWVKT